MNLSNGVNKIRAYQAKAYIKKFEDVIYSCWLEELYRQRMMELTRLRLEHAQRMDDLRRRIAEDRLDMERKLAEYNRQLREDVGHNRDGYTAYHSDDCTCGHRQRWVTHDIDPSKDRPQCTVCGKKWGDE